MVSTPKATVAGAGALGLSAALALADAGFAVTVWDPGPPLGNTSAVAGGMLAPVFEAVLDAEAAPHFDLLMAARDLWPALEVRSGVRLDRTGALAAGRAGWLDGVAAGVTRLGLHATEIPRRAAADLAPGLAPGLERVLMTREDWRLDPRAALGGLRAAAVAAGVSFRDEPAPGRGEAEILVLATGAAPGVAELAPEAAVLSPIKGHILRARPTEVGGVTVRGEGVYVTPADDGLAVGATMEAGVGDPQPDPAKAAPLLAAGRAAVPEPPTSTLRAAGRRPRGHPRRPAAGGFQPRAGRSPGRGRAPQRLADRPAGGPGHSRARDRPRSRPLRRAPRSGAVRRLVSRFRSSQAPCGGLERTSESIGTLANYMILVCFTDLKFAPALDRYAGEFQIQHTRALRRILQRPEGGASEVWLAAR
jgi:glycine oxidase